MARGYPFFLYMVLVVMAVMVGGQQEGVSDPCNPNPCGDNTRCEMAAGSNGVSSVISCSCLIGYSIPVGGESSGCQLTKGGSQAQRKPAPAIQGRPPAQPSSTQAPTLPPPALTTTARTEGTIFRESEGAGEPRSLEEEEDSAPRRLQEGHRPGQLRPRGGNKQVNKVFVDVDTKELFPEECLVHEDCEASQFCSLEADNTCVEACTVLAGVCGEDAVCTAKLHRPVCSCRYGYEGNAYDRCTKTPSRVGMKFRRK